MKLGFVSAILAHQSFEEVIAFAAEKGFSCVEIMCWPKGKAERRYAGVTHIDAAKLADGTVKQIQAVLSKYKVAISGLGYYPNPLDPDEEKRKFYGEHIKKVISACKTLGVGVMNTFIGRDPVKNSDDNFDMFKRVWPDIVRHAESNKVKIGIENCPMFFSADEWPGGKNLAHTPAMWRRMFAEITSDYFGLNYDPSHLLWQQIDYVRPVYEFKDKIFHVHLKDAKVYRDKLNEVGILATPLEFHAPKLPGLGDIDWGKFISALTDIRYTGSACIEVEDRACEDSPESIRRSLTQSRDYLRQFIAP